MLPFILALLSATVAAASAWYQYVQKEQEEQKKEKAQEEARSERAKADSANKRINELLETANDSLKTIVELQKELADKNDKLRSIQEEGYKQILGDGFPVLEAQMIGLGRPDEDVFSLLITNPGKYSIKAVSAEVSFVPIQADGFSNERKTQAVRQISDFRQQLKEQLIPNGNFGDLGPGWKAPVFTLTIRKDMENCTFYVTVFWSNRSKLDSYVGELIKNEKGLMDVDFRWISGSSPASAHRKK